MRGEEYNGKTKVKNKTYIILNYLKGVLQANQEGKADSLQDAFLIQRVLYLFQLHYLQAMRMKTYSENTGCQQAYNYLGRRSQWVCKAFSKKNF